MNQRELDKALTAILGRKPRKDRGVPRRPTSRLLRQPSYRRVTPEEVAAVSTASAEWSFRAVDSAALRTEPRHSRQMADGDSKRSTVTRVVFAHPRHAAKVVSGEASDDNYCRRGQHP
jgi:hypothetical protein